MQFFDRRTKAAAVMMMDYMSGTYSTGMPSRNAPDQVIRYLPRLQRAPCAEALVERPMRAATSRCMVMLQPSTKPPGGRRGSDVPRLSTA